MERLLPWLLHRLVLLPAGEVCLVFWKPCKSQFQSQLLSFHAYYSLERSSSSDTSCGTLEGRTTRVKTLANDKAFVCRIWVAFRSLSVCVWNSMDGDARRRGRLGGCAGRYPAPRPKEEVAAAAVDTDACAHIPSLSCCDAHVSRNCH